MKKNYKNSIKLISKIKNTTSKPGIYKMIDPDGIIIYIGKAKNLQKRLKSYIQKNNDEKTNKMMSHVCDFDLIVTETEEEALILESRLIRELKPKYNLIMRDDKSYSMIAIDTNHKFPRIYQTRQSDKLNKKIKRFGPLISSKSSKANILTIQSIFKLRTCTNSYFASRKRPCMEYQINRCSAPCVNMISEEEYMKNVEKSIKVLSGKIDKVIMLLSDKMKRYSKNREYESAVIVRDSIQNLEKMKQESYATTKEDGDYIGLYKIDNKCCIYTICIRNQCLIGSPKFIIDIESDAQLPFIIETFISQYYIAQLENLPKTIYIAQKIENKKLLSSSISQFHKSTLGIKIINKKGEQLDMIELATKNAKFNIESITSERDKINNIYNAIESQFKLPNPIASIEVYDNSHTSGSSQIGALIRVSKKNGFEKKLYKKFDMDNINQSDDYAMLSETIYKRFQSNVPPPDLMIIDGGKGQLSSAVKALKKINYEIPCIAIAKGPNRRSRKEKFYGTTFEGVMEIDNATEIMKYMQLIRDEAHHFAITQHKKNRNKKSLQTICEQIGGINKKTRIEILNNIGSFEKLEKLNAVEISQKFNVNMQTAVKLLRYIIEKSNK